MYDYLEQVKEDVKQFIIDRYDHDEIVELLRDDDTEKIYDECWTEDSVTGNTSGSYTFSSWDAHKNLYGNYGLLREAVEEFGMESLELDNLDPEWMDVTIRCYLLRQAVGEVFGELSDSGDYDMVEIFLKLIALVRESAIDEAIKEPLLDRLESLAEDETEFYEDDMDELIDDVVEESAEDPEADGEYLATLVRSELNYSNLF